MDGPLPLNGIVMFALSAFYIYVICPWLGEMLVPHEKDRSERVIPGFLITIIGICAIGIVILIPYGIYITVVQVIDNGITW